MWSFIVLLKGKIEQVHTIIVLFLPTDYVADLQDCIFDKVMMQPAPNQYVEALREIQVPEDLAAQYLRPDREEVINAFVSRFNRGHAPWSRRSSPGHLGIQLESGSQRTQAEGSERLVLRSPTPSWQTSDRPDTCTAWQKGKHGC